MLSHNLFNASPTNSVWIPRDVWALVRLRSCYGSRELQSRCCGVNLQNREAFSVLADGIQDRRSTHFAEHFTLVDTPGWFKSFSVPNNRSGNRKRAPRGGGRRNRSTTSKAVGGKVYDICRVVSQPIPMNAFTGFNSTGAYDLQMAFSLADFRIYAAGVLTTTTTVPNASEFTSLFDYYQIDKVDVTIFYSKNGSQMASGTGSYAVPIIYVVEDYDSAEATDLRAIQQYSTVTTHYMAESGGHVIRRTLRPRPLMLGSDGTTLMPQIQSPAWIDTAGANLLHFGLKMVWDPSARLINDDVGSINVSVKYHFKFKAPR